MRSRAGSWWGGATALALSAFGSVAAAQGLGQGGFGGQHPAPTLRSPLSAAPRAAMGYASPVSAASAHDGAGRLQDYLFGSHARERQAMPKVARFRADDGDGFVLDRTTAAALLRFEDSPEVWALSASSGPRGDMIFKNDVGDSVLRMTRLGGVTLFTEDRPEGLAVAFAGVANALAPPASIGPNALFQALAASSARASRAAQHLISFVLVPDATPKTDWLFADAALVTSEAFVRLGAQGAEGRSLAGRFARVEFLIGGGVQVQTVGAVVRITVSPGKGFAGRPSSQKIYLLLHRR